MDQVWDLTGRKLFNFEGHEAPVYSICPHQKENIHVCHYIHTYIHSWYLQIIIQLQFSFFSSYFQLQLMVRLRHGCMTTWDLELTILPLVMAAPLCYTVLMAVGNIICWIHLFIDKKCSLQIGMLLTVL